MKTKKHEKKKKLTLFNEASLRKIVGKGIGIGIFPTKSHEII